MEKRLRSVWVRKSPDNREKVAKFVDKIVRNAVQSEEDIPAVYRDLFLDLLFVLPADQLLNAIGHLGSKYKQNAPEVEQPKPEWDEEIPF